MERKIKALFTLMLLIVILGGCKSGGDNNLSTDLVNNPNSATGNIDKDKLPKFEFKEKEHDFGTIMQGEKVSYSFRFKNIGKSDLIISDAKASCGCTIPEYPKKPLKPGEEGKILVTFNTASRKGMQNKVVTITANTQPNNIHLRIKAKVMENIENELIKRGN